MILKKIKPLKKSRHALIVVSNKWQLRGFILSAERHTPKKLTIIKLAEFNISLEELKEFTNMDINIVNALDIHQPNFTSFLKIAKHSFNSFNNFKKKVLNELKSDNYFIITDNEYRSVEYFLRFCLKSVGAMYIYEHGLVNINNNLPLLLSHKLKAVMRWCVFRTITIIQYKESLLTGNILDKHYYCVKNNVKNCKCEVSGDIFLYANTMKIVNAKKNINKVLVYFSSGAFRYSDNLFIKDTIDGYYGAKHYAEKKGLKIYIKLKKNESKGYLMKADSALNLNQFINSTEDYYSVVSKYYPKTIVCSNSSTVIPESIAYGVEVLMYDCSSSIIKNSHGKDWADAGVGIILSNGKIKKTSNNNTQKKIMKKIYNLDCAREHVREKAL